jgi:hypothetical protein
MHESLWPFATDIVLQPNVGFCGKSGSSWSALETSITNPNLGVV